MLDELSKLHDATLHSVAFNWPQGQCEFKMSGGPYLIGDFSLVWDGVEELVIPRKNAWGKSILVLSARRFDENHFRFEMQSGDVIQIVASGYSLKRVTS